MTNKDTVASRIITRRAAMDLSQNELSRLSGVAPAQISRYESGVNVPSKRVISKLASAMGVPFEWLAYGGNREDGERELPSGGVELKLSLSQEALKKFKTLADASGMSLDEYILSVLLESLKNKPYLEG